MAKTMWSSLRLNLAGPTSKLNAPTHGFLKQMQLLRGLQPTSVETSFYTNKLLFSKLRELSAHGTHPRISLHSKTGVGGLFLFCFVFLPQEVQVQFPSLFAQQEVLSPSLPTL